MVKNKLSVVFAGLPNVGKTTLFNRLLGTSHKVGNWSGVTVEMVEKSIDYQSTVISFYDAPGLLSVYDSLDQGDYQVAREGIERADAIVHVIDARYLQRDLVLGLQLRYYQKPQITVLTHVEESTQALDTLQAMIPGEVLPENISIASLVERLMATSVISVDHLMSWPASLPKVGSDVASLITLSQQPEMDVVLAEGFYQTAARLVGKSVDHAKVELLDNIVMHPLYGLPIFLCMMYLLFSITVNVGGAFGDCLSDLIQLGVSYLPASGLGIQIMKAILSGISTGVGFLPVLMVMYMLLSVLEQSGYLSRVVFMTDRFMTILGLSGHAFIPMMLGFGCNVSAIEATKTASGKRQQLLTAVLIPFMACSARLSIFVMFAAAFFPQTGGLVVFGLYLLGIACGFLSVWLLNKALPGDQQYVALSIHLPSYQKPVMKQVLRVASRRTWRFICNAMKSIVVFAALFAFLASVDFELSAVRVDESILARLSQGLSPLFGFMGIGAENWPAVAALFSGIVAKETVITTLNALYHVDEGAEVMSVIEILYTLVERLFSVPQAVFLMEQSHTMIYSQYFSQASALAYMVFMLLYFPCISTLVVLAKAHGRLVAVMSFFWSTALAVWLSKITYWGLSYMDVLFLGVSLLLFQYMWRDHDPAFG